MLALQLTFVDFLPDLNVGIEGSLENISLFDLSMPVKDASWFLFLFELVDDSLAAGVELFNVLREQR